MWMLLPEVARACQELLKCGLSFCSKKCKCRDAGLSCTGLCYCGGTVTVNLLCCYINILLLGRVDFSNWDRVSSSC